MNHSTLSRPPHITSRRSVSLLSLALALSAGLAVSKLAAQPGGPGGADGPGCPPNAFALSDVTVAYSFSSEGDIERNDKIGTAEISRYEFEASFSLPAPKTWMLSTSISWKRDELDLTGAVPLPEKLEEIGLSFMAMKDLSTEIGPGWRAMAVISPSFASDSGTFSGDSFNFMGLASIEKEVSPTFSWNVGLVAMTRGDMPVIPLLGLRWNFAPRWEVALGLPRTSVTYKFSEALRLSADISMQGGTYHVSEAPAAGLGNTYLDYRESRLGLSAEYEMSNNLSLVVSGGMTLDREFDYYDRNFKLDGKSAAYGSFSLKYRF